MLRLVKLMSAFALMSMAGACAGGMGGGGIGFGYFDLVRAVPHRVADSAMVITPAEEWNRIPRQAYDIRREENWTLNGPFLDGVSFIGGLESGKKIVDQRRKADRKVSNFRADMTPQEIADMIESYYMIRGGSVEFEVTGLRPRPFLGQPGFQFDFTHLGGDEVERRGRAVGAVINDRLYLALFDATRLHYFDAGIGKFEQMVQSARLQG